MFSRRTEWDLSENPLSLALKELKAAGSSFIDLTESNPTQAGFHYPPQWLNAFVNADNFIYDPLSAGMLKAREAVCAYCALRGVLATPERVVLTASTSEAYSFLFRLLMNSGDGVLIPAPGYPLFSYLAGLNDVAEAHYRLVFDGKRWNIDFESLEKAARKGRAKAVVLVSPNNPTGSFVTREEFVRLNALCVKYGLAIISDEVFSDYVADKYKADYMSASSNTEVLSFAMAGLSKALALPQMKLGWIVVNGPKALAEQALARLDVIADTYLSVSTPVQNACVQWLPEAHLIRDEIMVRVGQNLAALQEAVKGAPNVELLPVEGGWYALLKLPMDIPEDEWVLRLLQQKHVYVHPGFYFDFEEEGMVVVSLLPEPTVFKAGVIALLSI